MLSFVPLTPAQRMPTPAPGCDSSPDSAPTEQCQAVQQLVSVRSSPARPGSARVLIPGLSEDPTLNSSCNTGKCSNWGIFHIINSDEQPSHPPFHPSLLLSTLPLCASLTPTLFSNLISFLMFLFALASFILLAKAFFFTFFLSDCVVFIQQLRYEPLNIK